MVTLLGHEITEAARQAGREAIASQIRSFTAAALVPAILPHIRPTKTCWVEATPARVAAAVADQLLWEANRAGQVKLAGSFLGTQYWRRIKPARGA